MKIELKIEKMSREITQLKRIVEKIQEQLEDAFLTEDEKEIIKQGERELKEGKTISLEKLKKELCIN
jgi:predicted DNA-binding protein